MINVAFVDWQMPVIEASSAKEREWEIIGRKALNDVNLNPSYDASAEAATAYDNLFERSEEKFEAYAKEGGLEMNKSFGNREIRSFFFFLILIFIFQSQT